MAGGSRKCIVPMTPSATTAGLYMRASAAAALSQHPTKVSSLMEGRDADNLRVIMTRICWTDDPCGCVANLGDPWVGDR